jgi:endonuclease/exonuclease/phosphatase family metal-dependent hydrolase
MNLSVQTKRCLTLLSCLSGVMFATACADPKDPGSDAGDGGGAEQPALTLTTFNVGLAPGLSPLVATRGAAVIEAIATEAATASAADPDELQVFCAQEFWVEDQWSALAGAVSETWSHEIRMQPIPGVGRCSPEELEPLGVCLATNCDVPEEEIVACGQTECAAEVAAISGACLPCMIDNVAFGLEQVAAACINPDAGAEDREPALYGGAVDIGLLTNAGVIASDTKELDSYFVRAGVIYAFLDDGTDADLHVFCTHLGSPLGGLPYQGVHGDYEGEHDAQITQLLEFIDEKTDDGDSVVVLGDLNMGPAIGEFSPEFPEHFARLVPGAGFDAPALETGGFCTWCSENSWLADDTRSSMIDHVLLRGPHRESFFTRTPFAELVSIEGLPEPAHLSDHFGARLGFWRYP